MNKVPCIVQGEASESDNDENDYYYKADSSKQPSSLPQGAVILGEAPESDEELPPSLALSTTSQAAQGAARKTRSTKTWDSLLHKKLNEYNASLHKNIVGLLKNVVQNSLIQLNASEQHLLKSQLRLQQAGMALRSLEQSGAQLGERLSCAACSAHLPHITIPPTSGPATP